MTARIGIFGAVLGTLGACGHPAGRTVTAAPPGRAQAADPLPAGAYAVVSHAATFHAAARADGPGFRAQLEPPKADASEDAAAGFVVRVRSSRAGWVEVDNPADAEVPGHCRGALEALAPFHLHFFVRSDALARVVARRYTESYPDGTQIDLLPGLPLGPPDAAGHLPSLRPGWRLTLALPAGAVGQSYAAPTPEMVRAFAKPAPPPDSAAVLISSAHLTVGPHQVAARDAMAVRSRPAGAGVLVNLADECTRITALAAPADVGEFGLAGLMGELAGMNGGGVTDTDTRYLYPKTALFWEDGTPAGEVREERHYDLWHRHPTRPDLVCIVHDLTKPDDLLGPNQERDPAAPRPATELTLCFRYADSNYRQ